jgi:hypothetical protein
VVKQMVAVEVLGEPLRVEEPVAVAIDHQRELMVKS